jgi:hypothetical protein
MSIKSKDKGRPCSLICDNFRQNVLLISPKRVKNEDEGKLDVFCKGLRCYRKMRFFDEGDTNTTDTNIDLSVGCAHRDESNGSAPLTLCSKRQDEETWFQEPSVLQYELQVGAGPEADPVLQFPSTASSGFNATCFTSGFL